MKFLSIVFLASVALGLASIPLNLATPRPHPSYPGTGTLGPPRPWPGESAPTSAFSAQAQPGVAERSRSLFVSIGNPSLFSRLGTWAVLEPSRLSTSSQGSSQSSDSFEVMQH